MESSILNYIMSAEECIYLRKGLNESELALLKGPAVTALSQFDAFTLIRESWEQIQNAEKPERSVASFVYVSVLWVFCPVNTLGHSPKNGIYFCSARHIFSHIGICH